MSLRHARLTLKVNLLMEQRRPTKNHGYIPVCPYCQERKATDMHEALVKRSDVQSWPKEEQELIYVKENCIVLCHQCHMEHGQTQYMTKWFVEHRTTQGYDLEAWLKSLPFKVTPRLGYVGGSDE
jgi:sarcosine oxidase delta subunit